MLGQAELQWLSIDAEDAWLVATALQTRSGLIAMSFHGRHGFLLLPGRGRTREMAISISFSCVLELLYNETGRSISTIMSIKRVMSSLEEVDLFWCFERIVRVNIWVRKRYMTVLFWASRV